MAEKNIIQNMILQLGQSQTERMPKELNSHFADVDERTSEELLLFTQKLSKQVNYYRNHIGEPADVWSNFFDYDETTVKQLLKSDSGSLPPHLALFLSFLELYKKPQAIINRMTNRHLDFYYRQVLQMEEKPAVADKAHVLLELKKNVEPVNMLPEHLFSAGKDNTGVELIYAPTRETIINASKVDSLRCLFVDKLGHGVVRYAEVANSVDGKGPALTGGESKWPGFGHQGLPQAEVGFAIASPVLRMQEGTRTVTVSLTLDNVDRTKLNDRDLQGAFSSFLTGEKGWMGPYGLSAATLNVGNVLTFTIEVPAEANAVVDYNAAIHGYGYATQSPILRVLLKADGASIGYNDFSDVTLQKMKLTVVVAGITSLKLESDGGTLDPKKAFLPFGPQPTIGSRFMVGCTEALSKKLSAVRLTVKWKSAPKNFQSHYTSYTNKNVNNNYFNAYVYFKDNGGWENSRTGVTLFDSDNATLPYSIPLAPSNIAPMSPEIMQDGFITFSLEKDFLHAAYRKEYVENMVTYIKQGTGSLTVLNEPYTPSIQSISLGYTAYSDEVNIAIASAEDNSNADVQFFHITYSGQMREDGYRRGKFDFVIDKSVSLLPVYNYEGELLIGFSDLSSGSSVNVLFQVAEGSDNPSEEQENIHWFVLCNNYWRSLSSSEVMLDTTNQLLTSGIIQFIIPAEATTWNTILPAGRIWLKAAITQHVTAVCQLIEVAANAIEVRFKDSNNDPKHLQTALGKGKITKLKSGMAAIKSVRQPYASFGGSAVEKDEAFHTRIAERLRHKNRCITAWDYERLILEAFPNVHKVKCIPHAKEDSWLAPGHVLIVVIPDMKNKDPRDLLQPKVNADTLSHITAYVQERAGNQVKVGVKNPTYQKILLDFKVKYYVGKEFNYYSEDLKRKLIEFLSPWAYIGERDISFGGKIYKSVLLNFVENLDYVDYITDFKMFSYTTIPNSNDIDVVQPKTPDVILVSENTHIINEAA
jgi:hypothetical protein